MITSISIENFKGVRERIEIPLKPITLLFGPNSAGKSTILHALHYLREVFERNNPNADATIAGGDFVDLGGFRQLSHRHSLLDPVRISVTLTASIADLPQVAAELPAPSWDIDSDDLLRDITTVRVELEIAWHNSLAAPFVQMYQVELNGQRLLSVVATPDRRDQELRVDMMHPCLQALEHVPELAQTWLGDNDATVARLPALTALLVYLQGQDAIPSSTSAKVDGRPIFSFSFAGGDDASPCWRSVEPLLAAVHFVSHEEQRSRARERRAQAIGMTLPPLDDQEQIDEEIDIDAGNLAVETLGRLLLGPAMLVRKLLSQQIYLGPMRERPSRNFEPPKSPDPARWAAGLGAWDKIFYFNSAKLLEINRWLGDADRLGTGYRLRVRRFVEADFDEPLVRALVEGDYLDLEFGGSSGFDSLQGLPVRRRISIEPVDREIDLAMSDVGVGLSQVIPVVVAAMDETAPLVMLEQPELHLHPAMQVRLTELFIDRAHRGFGPVILETHSEHMILRILRRIRETSEGELPEGHPGLTPDAVSVIYVERENGQVKASQLRIDKTGEFQDRWPSGFFEERAEELF